MGHGRTARGDYFWKYRPSSPLLPPQSSQLGAITGNTRSPPLSSPQPWSQRAHVPWETHLSMPAAPLGVPGNNAPRRRRQALSPASSPGAGRSTRIPGTSGHTPGQPPATTPTSQSPATHDRPYTSIRCRHSTMQAEDKNQERRSISPNPTRRGCKDSQPCQSNPAPKHNQHSGENAGKQRPRRMRNHISRRLFRPPSRAPL